MKSNAIVSGCRKLMQTSRDLEKVDDKLTRHATARKGESSLFDEKCSHLNAVAQGVMASVKHGTTALITHSFTSSDKPLSVLIDVCRLPANNQDEHLDPAKKSNDLERISHLVDAFLEDVESLAYASKSAANCCSHSSIYKQYENALTNMQSTSNAIADLAKSSVSEENDKRDLHLAKLIEFQEKWMETHSDVIHLVTASLDVKDLFETLVEEIYRLDCLYCCNRTDMEMFLILCYL